MSAWLSRVLRRGSYQDENSAIENAGDQTGKIVKVQLHTDRVVLASDDALQNSFSDSSAHHTATVKRSHTRALRAMELEKSTMLHEATENAANAQPSASWRMTMMRSARSISSGIKKAHEHAD